MTRLALTVLASGVVVAGCVSRISPEADALMVRLDVVERGLLGTEAALCSRPSAPTDPRTDRARESVKQAEEALDFARWSTARWQAGDGRGVDERLRVLALRLRAVESDLESAGVAPSAGLTGMLPRVPIERPNDNVVSTDAALQRDQARLSGSLPRNP